MNEQDMHAIERNSKRHSKIGEIDVSMRIGKWDYLTD